MFIIHIHSAGVNVVFSTFQMLTSDCQNDCNREKSSLIACPVPSSHGLLIDQNGRKRERRVWVVVF